MLFHDGVALRGDAVEEINGSLVGRLDEVYERVGALGALVQARDAEGHDGCGRWLC